MCLFEGNLLGTRPECENMNLEIVLWLVMFFCMAASMLESIFCCKVFLRSSTNSTFAPIRSLTFYS